MFKKIIGPKVIVAAVVAGAFLLSSAPLVASGATIRVEVAGIPVIKGSVRATLDPNPKAFSNAETALQTVEVEVKSHKMILTFTQVPFGDYAVKVIHDKNDNQKLDLSLLGIPAESYGISNNARRRFGLPSFDEAKFIVDQEEVDLGVELKPHSLF